MSRSSSTPAVEGMGAILTENGAAFRVWAPNASSVSVKGEFNDWSDAADPLSNEGNGYWYGQVSGAKVGQEYKFHLTNGEAAFDRVDPYARAVTNSIGNGIIYDPDAFDWEGDDFSCPPHNELVIYEMHVGSFATEGEGVGDLYGLVDKLDHLLHLGVTAIQLMPLAEFAGDYSWGYNPAHVFAVESVYGGPDGLKTLVKEAHRRGLAVIQDVVYNHFGPSDLNLWQFDGWSENGKGGIYFYNDWRSATPWGDTRPDYGRGEVRQFIHDNAMMWLGEYHVDGLRYDMTPYIRSVDGSGFDLSEGWNLMRWVNSDVRDRYPDTITIAEDLHSHWEVTSTGPEGACFHSQWDARFVHPVREALIVANDDYRSTVAVKNAITASFGDAFARVVYTESHDEVANGRARVPQEVEPANATGWPAQKRSTLGAGLVLTVPGIPMIFQGQEFLEGGWFRDDVPLDWNRNADFSGIVLLYRDLIKLRLNAKGTTNGLTGQGIRVFHEHDDNNLIAFQRWRDHGPGDDTVVVLNLDTEARSDYRIGMPNPGTWRLRFNSDARAYSAIFGDFVSTDVEASGDDYDGMDASATVSVGPYSMLIYSQDA